MGLRELKRKQTRQLIVDTAWRLFADRGFDDVTVTEIASEAQVAKATVFNYFPTKEDLFFPRLEDFGARLVEAVATRDAGETALAAFRRHLLGSGGLLDQVEAGDAEALHRLRTVNRVIAASPALRAREREAFAAAAASLAALLASEARGPAGDVGADVAANALFGVHCALVDYVRRRVLADDQVAFLAAGFREQAIRAFTLLEGGLGDRFTAPSGDRPR
ncbi:TetR/AcrR family transcriptional regulator [Actinoallomurus bryophytorum]|uniref:TetR family transcriptional regulator n=1 Tax=Actinoallomurus bryophytorum TaxID=1490222 RepID=A0A543CHW5_9ACTN|nr:TetR/AcrR family transcriptional regulator [Actinoallomurus bryophytorum]TQL96694.1 TetR family transcriptional regulator [Actinoallomurus bryophytorum]